MDPYEKLANAIVLSAVNDYREALRILSRNPSNRESLNEKKAIEQFFRSSWYGILTDVDGEWLIRKLNEEAK